jgi:hypothetical protein
MPEVTYRGANSRYRRLFFPVMLFYVVFCFVGPGVMFAFKGHPPMWAMAVISVISGAPIAGVFWLMGRYLRETDEFTRKIQLDALLPGASITLSLAVIWGFLELYQVAPRAKIFSPMMLVGPAFFFFYGITFMIQHLLRGESCREAPSPGQDEK